jgi:mRNA (guanine-N7-)-methyltransferase
MEKDITQSLINIGIGDLLECLSKTKTKNPPIKPAKEEFDKYVNKINKERRGNSSIIGLRDFHNWIKRMMITNIKNTLKKENISLLDIAVGRGGDLDKWNQAGIKNVYGFDKDKESIFSINPFNPGAEQRLKNYRNLKVNVKFAVGDATLPTTDMLDKIDSFLHENKQDSFQMISCQFALHYFFKSEQSVRIVFSLIQKYLRKGGYFFGTTVDSTYVKTYLKENKKHQLFEISSNMFKVKSHTPFGNKYTFEIKDTVDSSGNYFNIMGASEEYLVDFGVLIKIAQEYGLVPVYKNFFESYTLNGKTEYTSTKSFMTFDEIKNLWQPKTRAMNEDELEINKFYRTFVFQKI